MTRRARDGAVRAHTNAQAKVNLFLRVLAREDTGYHQIETLFCRLDLGDDVTVHVGARGRSLDCAGDAIPAGGLGPVEQNLAWRAASGFRAATGWPDDWAIEITKRIPVGGGLGGGSADAAAVLRCLNALAPGPLPPAALLSLAASLGADVSFLASDAVLAFGWGRGERLLTLPPLPSRNVLLLCFPFGIATRDAYGWLDADGPSEQPPGCVLNLEALGSWPGVRGLAANGFESHVTAREPAIRAALERLRRSLLDDDIALMAGSGATVFRVSATNTDVPVHDLPQSPRPIITRTATRVGAITLSD